MCQGPTYRSISVPIERSSTLTELRLTRGSGRDEQVKSLLAQVLVFRLREHCQHPRRSDGGGRIRALPVVPLEGGVNRPPRMNDYDGGMAAGKQDDAEGVCLPKAGPIRIPSRSRYSYDGPTAAAASVRRGFGLEPEPAALAGNSGHSSDHRSILRERAGVFRSNRHNPDWCRGDRQGLGRRTRFVCVATGSRRHAVLWHILFPGDSLQEPTPGGRFEECRVVVVTLGDSPVPWQADLQGRGRTP